MRLDDSVTHRNIMRVRSAEMCKTIYNNIMVREKFLLDDANANILLSNSNSMVSLKCICRLLDHTKDIDINYLIVDPTPCSKLNFEDKLKEYDNLSITSIVRLMRGGGGELQVPDVIFAFNTKSKHLTQLSEMFPKVKIVHFGLIKTDEDNYDIKYAMNNLLKYLALNRKLVGIDSILNYI